MLKFLEGFTKESQFAVDPIAQAIVEQDRRLVAGSIDSLVGLDEFNQTTFAREAVAPSGVVDCLVGCLRLPGPGGRVFGYSIHRRQSQGYASERLREVNALFAREWAHMVLAGQLVPEPDPRVSRFAALSSRLRQIALALLDGERPKAVAARLELSENTVREYIRQIYPRLGVDDHIHLLVEYRPLRQKLLN